jgi:hypothetical protein
MSRFRRRAKTARADSFQPSPVVVEGLEQRTLLSATYVPGAIHVSIFYDTNSNGVRDTGERGLSGWAVAATLTDSTGHTVTRQGVTDTKGNVGFTDYVDSSVGEEPFAIIAVPTRKEFRCTNHGTKSNAWVSSAHPSAVFAMTDVSTLTGTIVNQYRRADGVAVNTPLTDRVIFDDRNRNKVLDVGEPQAMSDLHGHYSLTLRSGTHTLRVEALAGWTAIAGQSVVKTATVFPGAVLPTFAVMMAAPTVVDVTVAYTDNVADGRTDSAMRTAVLGAFAEVNRVYANSDTNTLINVVSINPTNYSENGDLSQDLTRLGTAGGGFLADVRRNRNNDGADLAMLLVGRTDSDTIGIAYEYSAETQDDQLAYSVVYGLNGDVMAHEIGHNLGAGHDVGVDAQDDAPAPYAHAFSVSGDDGRIYHDVMSYAKGTELPFFSSPKFSWQGKLLGDPRTADNARIVREIAPIVAAYR